MEPLLRYLRPIAVNPISRMNLPLHVDGEFRRCGFATLSGWSYAFIQQWLANGSITWYLWKLEAGLVADRLDWFA